MFSLGNRLFCRLRTIAVPADPSKRWVLESIDRHPERAAWRDVPDGPGGLVTAADGALVLMAHLRFPAHIGVWLKPEARVIHCSEQHGVCCETVLALRQMGWKKLTFYEPIIGRMKFDRLPGIFGICDTDQAPS